MCIGIIVHNVHFIYFFQCQNHRFLLLYLLATLSNLYQYIKGITILKFLIFFGGGDAYGGTILILLIFKGRLLERGAYFENLTFLFREGRLLESERSLDRLR